MANLSLKLFANSNSDSDRTFNSGSAHPGTSSSAISKTCNTSSPIAMSTSRATCSSRRSAFSFPADSAASKVPSLCSLILDLCSFIAGAKFRRHLAVTCSMFRRVNIVSNLDLIVQCTDQLIEQWREQYSTSTVHTDIVHQSKNLLLNVFGFIAFDYDLEMFSRNHEHTPNELTRALQDLLSIYSVVIYSPRSVSLIYLTFSVKYRRARRIIHQYFNQMIDRELTQTSQWRADRKRTSLIASLVASLQADEKAEAMKNEPEKKGPIDSKYHSPP